MSRRARIGLVSTTAGTASVAAAVHHNAARGPYQDATVPAASAPTGITPQETKRTVAITRGSNAVGVAICR